VTSPRPQWRQLTASRARRIDAGIRPIVRSLAAATRPDVRWLVPVGVITMAGVIADVAAEGLPGGALGVVLVGLLAIASGCWTVALSERIRDMRVVVPALVGLGLCGAGLYWAQTDGPGFVVGYLALAGLALRVPRRIALVAGAPIVTAIAVASAHDSANPASTILAGVLGAGFLFVTSAVAAFSRDAHRRAETQLSREAAVREAREQMAKLAERSRLARELHDVLAHCLSGLSVQLEGARLLATTTAADARLATQIADAQRLAQGGMVNARRALQALRGDETPGPAKLPELVTATASTWDIPISFHVEGTPGPLTPEAGLTVYRTVQEALTNSAKHAGRGTQVSVLLAWSPGGLEVSITDSGGDGVDAGLTSSGFGLTSMAERAAAHGGRLDFGAADNGFRVRLWLPLALAPALRRS
jgi:signal transduction histidine kinase